MNTENSADTFSLKDLLEAKAKALMEFLGVTDSLYHCLLVKDLGELGRVLEQRQNLIHSIEEIDIKVVERWSQNSLKEKSVFNPARDQLGFILKKIKDLLHRVADLDKRCLAQGEFLREEIQKELLTMRQGWKAARKYSQGTGFQPRFMDLRQ